MVDHVRPGDLVIDPSDRICLVLALEGDMVALYDNVNFGAFGISFFGAGRVRRISCAPRAEVEGG